MGFALFFDPNAQQARAKRVGAIAASYKKLSEEGAGRSVRHADQELRSQAEGQRNQQHEAETGEYLRGGRRRSIAGNIETREIGLAFWNVAVARRVPC
jgi:hypothetical protein